MPSSYPMESKTLKQVVPVTYTLGEMFFAAFTFEGF